MTKKNSYLAHYGIMGMKWGIRRYQPYPKGEGRKGKFLNYERIHNRLDKKSVRQAAKEMQADVDALYLFDKAQAQKSKNPKRAAKTMEKARSRIDKRNEYKKNREAIEAEMWKNISDAIESGNDVTIRKQIRNGASLADMYKDEYLHTFSRFEKYGKKYITTIYGVPYQQFPGGVVGSKIEVTKSKNKTGGATIVV